MDGDGLVDESRDDPRRPCSGGNTATASCGRDNGRVGDVEGTEVSGEVSNAGLGALCSASMLINLFIALVSGQWECKTWTHERTSNPRARGQGLDSQIWTIE